MSNGQVPRDDNDSPALGLWDSTGHQIVPAQAVSVATDSSGQKYGVMNVNASFSASSLAINDPTTTTQKAGVNAGGSLQVAGQGTAGSPAGGVVSIQGVASGTAIPISGSITATNPSVGTDGSAIPASSTLIGASDGTNLQQLLVESASNRNLRTGIYSGANEATVTGANALKVDNSAVTQPVSAASLPLPSGASMAAKQPALGTAGSASSDVLSVQGIASMTALKVDGSAVTQPVSGTVTANAGTGNFTVAQATGSNLHAVIDAGSALMGGVYVVDSGGTNKAAVDSAGNQAIKGGFTEQASLSAGSLNADLVPSTDVSAYKQWSLQVLTVATGGTLTFQGSNDGSTFNSVDFFNAGNSAAPGTSVGATGLYYGPVVYRYLRVRQTAYTSGSSTGVLELYAVPAFLTTNTTVQNNPNATASGVGTSDGHLISAASTNATNLKASSGQVYGYTVTNTNAAFRYLKLYNKASSPTVGTDTPFRTIGVPPTSTVSYSSPVGLKMSTGISYATTTGIADSDSAAVGASDLSIDIDWI